MALACLLSYVVMTKPLNAVVDDRNELLGGLWAGVSTAFVFRDSRAKSLSAGVGRLVATFVSFMLCFPYLWFMRATPLGMSALIAAGTLVMVLLGRRDDIVTTAVGTVVMMAVAIANPSDAWRQPLLRLFDTIVGVMIGVACKWAASFGFYRPKGESVR